MQEWIYQSCINECVSYVWKWYTQTDWKYLLRQRVFMLIESGILIESTNIHIFIFNRIPRFIVKQFSVYELNEFHFDDWEQREREREKMRKITKIKENLYEFKLLLKLYILFAMKNNFINSINSTKMKQNELYSQKTWIVQFW